MCFFSEKFVLAHFLQYNSNRINKKIIRYEKNEKK